MHLIVRAAAAFANSGVGLDAQSGGTRPQLTATSFLAARCRVQ